MSISLTISKMKLYKFYAGNYRKKESIPGIVYTVIVVSIVFIILVMP